MDKVYYIAHIALKVQSDIDLEEYEAEKEFLVPILHTDRIIPVSVKLVDRIIEPQNPGINYGLLRSWKGQGKEIRIYPFGKIAENAISSSYDGEEIQICIDRNVWGIHMHTFRIWSYIYLEQILLESGALSLHSASIIYRGQAILFTAPSETGKTTQTDIWHRMNAEVLDLNGDRTILQSTDQGWLACGIPISGTSTRCHQAAFPIKAIVLVNRNPVDTVSQPSIMETIRFLYGQVTINDMVEKNAEDALNLLEKLITEVQIIKLNCTMNDSAYYALYHELYKED